MAVSVMILAGVMMRRARFLLACLALLMLLACGDTGATPQPQTTTASAGQPAARTPSAPATASPSVSAATPLPIASPASPTRADGTPSPSIASSGSPTRAATPVPNEPLALPGKYTTFDFVDAERGWLAREQYLFATADGGRSWQPRGTLPATMSVIDFVSIDFGWGSDGNAIFETDDGGVNWRPLAGVPVQFGFDLVDRTHAWLRGVGGLRTTDDGGRNWRAVATPCEDSGARSYSLAFPQPEVGWLICTGQPATIMQFKWVYRTLDGGEHWDLVASTEQKGAASGLPTLPVVGYLPVIAATDADHAWFTLSRANDITRTGDGGRTWQTQLITQVDGTPLGHLDFVSPTHGFLAVAGGLLATTDGGATWAVIPGVALR